VVLLLEKLFNRGNMKNIIVAHHGHYSVERCSSPLLRIYLFNEK
jgi:hypothetical protein